MPAHKCAWISHSKPVLVVRFFGQSDQNQIANKSQNEKLYGATAAAAAALLRVNKQAMRVQQPQQPKCLCCTRRGIQAKPRAKQVF